MGRNISKIQAILRKHGGEILPRRIITGEIVDKRLVKVVQGLREREFLKGTAFEKRALSMNVDPYSLLLGILVGISITLMLGIVTIEIWLPRTISRITGKAMAETIKIVGQLLRT